MRDVRTRSAAKPRRAFAAATSPVSPAPRQRRDVKPCRQDRKAVVADPLVLHLDSYGRSPPTLRSLAPTASVEQQMIAEIDKAPEAGDTMGGTFEGDRDGLPPGLGSYCTGIGSSMAVSRRR